jgi:hypothetical protein
VRPDDERRVAEKAHAAEYRARRRDIDDCLEKRLGRCAESRNEQGVR